MVQMPTRSISLDEFLKRPETKPASEYIDGQIIQKPMPQGQHSTIQGELVTAINAVTKANRIAWAFPELRCTYPAGSHPADVYGGRSIVPDVAVFRWERCPLTKMAALPTPSKPSPTGLSKSLVRNNPLPALPATSSTVSITAVSLAGSSTLMSVWFKSMTLTSASPPWKPRQIAYPCHPSPMPFTSPSANSSVGSKSAEDTPAKTGFTKTSGPI